MNETNLTSAQEADKFEIRLTNEPESSIVAEVGRFLVDYNEKILGVKRGSAFAAAYADDELIGGISFRWYGDEAFIDIVAVREDSMREGVGSQLMAAVEQELVRRGYHRVTVETDAFQAPEFYSRLGYEHIATTPKHLGGYDRLTFCKILPQGLCE